MTSCANSSNNILNKLLNINATESDGEDVSSDENSCYSELSNSIVDFESDDSVSGEDYGTEGFTIVDTFLARDRTTVWIDISKEILRGRQSICSTEIESAPTPYASSKIKKDSPLSAFQLIFNQHILKTIVECTNKYAEKQNKEDFSLDEKEFLKVIALLCVRGILGLGQEHYPLCWQQNFGPNLFKRNMARERFANIMSHLHFDKENTESIKDSFAPISEIWNVFLSNSRSCYIPGNSLTVDELLYPMKCRSSFRLFLPQLPERFGIKYWVLVDRNSGYLLNGFPHSANKEDIPQNRKLEDYVVMRLAEPYFGSGVNITTNKIYATVKLAQELQQKNLTLVGRIKRNRMELPKVIKSNNSLYSTKFYRNKDEHTLTSYQERKKRKTLILSTKHPKISISETGKREPDTVSYYNRNRVGGKCLEKMCRRYSTRAGTHKWTIHVFYNILDLILINSWILYKETLKLNISRKCFIQELVLEILKYNEEPVLVPNVRYTSRKRCKIRLGCKNSSYFSCRKCGKTCCGKCGTKWCLCANCAHGS